MRIEDIKEYEIKEHRFLNDINTDAYVLSHKKTGARVVLMPNDEENKVFYIGFRTPPKDSTGVAHIVEHTVLCGSEKYPIKDPFVELCKGSLNTFLNAMTYPDKTVYPVASCNDFDFKNLMDVYLDAVFHPNIYREEKIFRQEGWHYELENADDDLSINGVVYSEMKGAFSDPDDIVERQIMNSVFPDTPYGVESGGDPDVIPELTYEDFLDFHSQYYHPSNSYIFIYGNCDMAERLEYIDKEYLSKYERIEVTSDIPKQKAFDMRRDVVIEYPLTENEDDEDKTYLNLTYCFSDYSDRELPIVLRTFEYAFSGNPAAPLRKALLDAGIGNEVYASSDCSIKQNLFGFYAKGANPEDKDEFLNIIQKELERTVKEGFDKKTLLAFLVREEFKYREADFGRIPKGLAYGLDLLDSWLYDDELALYHIECLDIYRDLKKAVETDYFENLLKKYFLENNHCISCMGVPVKGLTLKKEKELEEALSDIKSKLSKEEIEKIVEDTKALKEYQKSPDKPEDLEKIKLLKVSDIKKETRADKNELFELNGVKYLKQDIFTSGIAYLTMLFDIDNISAEHIRFFPILANMLGRLDTKELKYGDLSNEIKLYTGGMNMSFNNCKNIKTGKIKSYFEINIKFLYENKEKVFDLLSQILFESVLDDKDKIKEYLSELRSQGESMLVSSPHTVALTRATSYFDKMFKMNDISMGVDAVRFITSLEKDMDNSVDKIISEFKTIIPMIFRKENMFINLTTPKDKPNILDDELSKFIDRLYTEEVKKDTFDVELNQGNEAFIYPGQVQFVALAGEYISKGLKYKGAFNVLRTIMAYDYLWNNVRVEGGAYGCFANFTMSGICSIVSYRDPHINNTLKIYRNLSNFLDDFECNERQMNQYIIGAISDIDVPQTASIEGKANCIYYLTGVTEEDRQKVRDEILSCSKEDIRSLSENIKAAFSKEYICVVGAEGKIKENEKLFDKVLSLV
ncbi:MAG: insulinase family protein [Lachnospiraceae bacterium]|nr:insulinase family protein [Lachnospiraceae bacterium]